MLTYFAEDGSYGSAEGMYVVNTGTWSESEWDMIERAHDMERVSIARSLAQSGWTTV